VSNKDERELLLKASIEFGASYLCYIKTGTLGRTLYIEAKDRTASREIRKKTPHKWNGLYTIVLFTPPEEEIPKDITMADVLHIGKQSI
jgi:hypothetical protein